MHAACHCNPDSLNKSDLVFVSVTRILKILMYVTQASWASGFQNKLFKSNTCSLMVRAPLATRMLLAMLLGMAGRPFIAWRAVWSQHGPPLFGRSTGRASRIVRHQGPRQLDLPNIQPLQIQNARAELEAIISQGFYFYKLQYLPPHVLEELKAQQQQWGMRSCRSSECSRGQSDCRNRSSANHHGFARGSMWQPQEHPAG